MKLTLILCSFIALTANAQQFDFESAYDKYPLVPEGLLEAVAWTNTRIKHLEDVQPSCTGMPAAYGVMGLHENGEGYFNENGKIVAQISGISVDEQKQSANKQILAYAASFDQLMRSKVNAAHEFSNPNHIRSVLQELSEIPNEGIVNELAKDMQAYEVLRFLMSVDQANQFNFNPYNFDLEAVFGSQNYRVLSCDQIRFTETGIRSDKDELYVGAAEKSGDYGPALWNPAATCNFSSRSGTAISAITIHTVQGTYAGCISWFQNCAASVSAHYVIRSSDGQVTQMVAEADKAWHVGTENPYTIGYEHEGYVNDPIWYTEAMYNSSADLSRDVVDSGYGIPPLRTYYKEATSTGFVLGGCTKIKGHHHYPNQSHTDPGINWNWEKYYKLINNDYTPTLMSSASGTLTDSGGAGGNYQDDERYFWLIQPANAVNITLSFSSFELEDWYDNLFIYDGDSIDDPLIGSYTDLNSPGTIVSSGNSLLLEFRSDCGTVAPGWVANYTSTQLGIDNLNDESIVLFPNPATDQLMITNASQDVVVEIIDLTGRTCLRSSNSILDVAHLASGKYLVHLQSNNQIVVKSLIIK